ncbi:signal recognition particle protein [soil metagenome]
MFESLGDKFESVFKKLRGQSNLSEANMKDALREVRLALLEADVNFKVVKDFVAAVQIKAMGQDVIKGVNPAQQLVKIVNDELVIMMSGDPNHQDRPFIVQPGKMNVILMLGLQGAGKTTFCGKLALYLTKKNCKPLLAACDIYRPAAIDQLKAVGKQLGFPVYSREAGVSVNDIIDGALQQAKESGRDVVIVDTAGRLHIDEVKMDELISIRDVYKPDYTFLVADAMTGQDAVNSAKAFNEQVGIDGVCLTKMDGDARGGAALSIKAVTGKPIVFVGMGEKPENLEQFHPDRVAQRILGMGDVVSLVEKAQEAINEREAMEMQDKLTTGKFSYDDFVKQLRTIRKMGSLGGLMKLIPGMGQVMKDIDPDVMEKELKRVESMIGSMTSQERADGDLMSKEAKRRDRVAKGSGQTLKQVTDVVRNFDNMRAMMAQMGAGGGGGMFGGGGGLGGLLGGMNPFGRGGGGGMPGMPPGFPGMGGGGGMGMPNPNLPMTKKMLRQQKEMLRQQQRELNARNPVRKSKKKRR